MGFLLFLAFSLLLTRASPLTEDPKSSCSHKLKEDHHHHQPNSSNIYLTLHHPRSPCSKAALPDLPFSDVLRHDDSRVHAFASRLTKSSTSHKSHADRLATSSVSVPLTLGTPIGILNYFTEIGLGTPAANYVVVVDTGSSLSWLQCSPCLVYCHEQVGPVFNPAASSTYRVVPCSATECGVLQSATRNPSGCTRSNVCVYEAGYGDNSFSLGYLAKDTLSLASSPAVLPGFVFGCGQDNEGLFGKAAGLIGLAKNEISLFSQLSPKLGSTFSYCLPTAASSGYLSIGSSYDMSKFSYTPMVTNSLDNTLYFIRLVGMTVGGKVLPVATSAYTETPTVIDSGTVITRLPSGVYTALSEAVVAAVGNLASRAPAQSIFDTCFQGSVEGLGVLEVTMNFEGGAVLKLRVTNVFIDVDKSTTCLAFAAAGTVAIIGNLQQQTFSVVYDVGRSQIGFAADGCS